MGGLYGGWVFTVGSSIQWVGLYSGWVIRWVGLYGRVLYIVGGLYGGGSIRWVGLYGGSIWWGVYMVGSLYGVRWGILFFSLSGILV